MADYLKDIFAVCLSVVLLVICPVSLMAVREQEAAAMEAMSIAAELSEEIRKTGYVEYAGLADAAGRLAIIGYELDLSHERRISEGRIVNGIYVESGHGYEVHPFRDIEETCMHGSDYPLYKNDRLSVTVRSGRRQYTFGGLVLNEAA